MPESFIEKIEELTRRLTKLRIQELDEYRFFWENTYALLVVADEKYFIKISPSWVSVLGFSINEIKSVPWMHLIHPDDRPKTLARANQTKSLHRENPLPFRNRYRKKDGTYTLLEWRSSSYIRGYFCAVAIEITGEKSEGDKRNR